MDIDALNGRVALLVDDEAFFLSSVVEGLHAVAPGLEVLTASDGVAALELLDRRLVDVIVTDIQMPQLDGFGLIAELISRGLDVSVVVLTAFQRPSERERERLALAIECLEKPLDFNQLLAVLIRLMRMRTTRQLVAVSLQGLLQTLEIERGDAVIRAQHDDEVVWIYVQAGRMVHATNDRETGMRIAGRALMWSKPRVEVHRLPPGHERSFDAGISQVMLEAARMDDEAQPHEFDPAAPFASLESFLPPPPPFGTPQPTPSAADHAAIVKEEKMDNIKESLEMTNEITGTLGVALVDYASGMTLGTLGSGINLEVAAAGNMDVMRAKQRVMDQLGIDGGIEDILITLEKQYHLLRPVGESMFLYLALDRKLANLAMARMQLANIGSSVRIR